MVIYGNFGDMSYNKDINGVHVQNWGLKAPTGSLIGVDGRSNTLLQIRSQ
jgi:hypothetical protein